VIADRQKGYAKLSAYLEEHLHRREQEPPRGDMVDKILVGVPDNDGNPASFAEKVAVVTNFTVGGLGTTTYALATLWYHLRRIQSRSSESSSTPRSTSRSSKKTSGRIRAFRRRAGPSPGTTSSRPSDSRGRHDHAQLGIDVFGPRSFRGPA